MRLNSKMILLLAMLSGFFAFSLTINTLSVQKKAPQGVFVVAATRDMNLGRLIAEDDIKLLPPPRGSNLALSYDDPQKVIGKMVRNPIRQGQAITSADLVSQGDNLSSLIPQGYRATTLNPNLSRQTIDFLKFGTRVDVLYTDTSSSSIETKTIMKYVLVMNISKKDSPQPEVTLAVRPEGAEMLALLSTRGKLDLVIRPMGDVNAREEYMNIDEILGKKTGFLPTPIEAPGIEVIRGTRKEKVQV